MRRAIEPIAEARDDWWIIGEVATRMGYGEISPRDAETLAVRDDDRIRVTSRRFSPLPSSSSRVLFKTIFGLFLLGFLSSGMLSLYC